jgi:small-conductance mechanosensitive channel
VILVNVLDRAAASLGEALPRLGGAIVLLVLGLLLAALAGRIVGRVLDAVGLNGLAQRFGVDRILARLGVTGSASSLVGTAVRVALVIVTVVAAVSLLGLAALSTALNELILFLPKLFVALVLLLVGMVVAEFLGDRVQRLGEQMDLPGPLRQVTEAVVVALFALTALAQVGVPTMILTGLVALLILAATLTFALAFGLGGRDLARHVSAGRYVGNSYRIGDRVQVAGVAGTISRLESAATVLQTEAGEEVRVPNQLMLDSVVTLTPRDESAAS